MRKRCHLLRARRRNATPAASGVPEARAASRKQRAAITHEVHDGKGRLTIGDVVHSEMHPYTGPDGSTTTLRDSLFSTVPGSPAYVAVADKHEVRLPQYGMQWSSQGRNAIQADYRIRHTA